MPQKKEKKKTNKKSHKKKHLNQTNQNIIFQSIPNYSSSQAAGHQYNKNKVYFGPAMQQESRTDNLVGDLVGKLINKIESDKTQQTQDYSKEIQPINNSNSNSGNNSVVNIYSDGTKNEDKKPDKKPDEKASQTTEAGESLSDAVSSGMRSAARSTTEEFFLSAGAGLASIGGAALSTAGWRNRKSIRNSISSFPTNAKNRLSSISERFKNPRAYSQFEDALSPSVTGSPVASAAGARAASVTGSRRPSNASSQGPMAILSESVGISPARTRTASAARPRSNSASSENYADVFIPENLGEQFSNVRTPAPRRSGLNTIQRGFLKRNLRNQGLDTANRSPINQDILRGGFSSSSPRRSVIISQNQSSDSITRARTSGIQQHDGVSTRSIRAETGEPHAQLQMGTPTRKKLNPLPKSSEKSPSTPKLSDLKPLPAKRGRPKGSGAPKPMKIKYDKPGRPALQPDPMEPETTNAPKLRLPRKK